MVGCKLNNHQWFTRDCEQCFNNLTGEWNRSRTEIARLREQLQSKHDYGPASPGEQQQAPHRPDDNGLVDMQSCPFCQGTGKEGGDA